ncbi:protease modulator HflC [Alkaliphilus sp. B6464]|uniref:protease modulator HflC n=1 Tax=Alkaliphilus sp. B6464 TaxID=2731219 RepID=UPI001BABFF7A|nr:protease modulator HflC [Alkaliphilus sp. B6464]QUH22154.1 protease modulator HflC [Alkaliphilus sp. B6464]
MNNFNNIDSQQLKKMVLNKLKEKAKVYGIVAGVIVVSLIGFNLFTYTVNEVNQAVVTRFGEVVRIVVDEKTVEITEEINGDSKFKNVKIIEGKGLHLKWPFIEHVEKYPNRLLTYDASPREVTTSDKKKVVLDNNAHWRIVNPLAFRVSVENINSANTKLDDIIYSRLNEKIGLTDGTTLISDKEYIYEMLNATKDIANEDVKKFGIKIEDIKIKKTDLPQENNQNIFNRMITERQKMAKKFRSEGEEESKKIKAEADKQVTIIKAQAYKEAEKTRGEGDAEALRIYANAYNKDPEFYEFYRTLTAYKSTLKDNKLVIGSDSPFLKYLLGNR